MCLAVPGQLVSLDEGDALLRSGRVKFGGIFKTVSLVCVPEAKVGDFVLVHAGVAIAMVDEQEAVRIFEVLREISDESELAG